MLYNISYWWFFLSQGKQWTKYLAHLKIWKPKPCLLMFASLVALDGFYLLLSTQLTAYLTLKWSGWSIFYPLSHTQKLLFVALKQLQTMLWIINMLFLIDCEQMWHPLWKQLSHWQMFMQNGEYLQLLCYLIQLQFMISQNEFVEFFGVFQDNCQIWVTWAFSIICVCTTAFKVSIPPLNYCFRQSRVWITLIKSLVCLNSIFSPSETNDLSTHEIQIFPFFWKFATVASLK